MKEKTNEKKVVVEPVVEDTSVADHSSTSKEKKLLPSYSMSARFSIVTLCLAVAGVVISVESLLKLREWSSGLKNFENQIEKHIETEQHRLDNLDHALKNIGARQDELDKKLHKYHSSLSAIAPLLQKNAQEANSVDIQWQLQKAYSWLQEASLDLRWSGDWKGALLLLQAADDIIVQLNIATLQPVHELLVQDMALLSAIKPIEEKANLEQIKNLSEEVLVLPSPKMTSLSITKSEEKSNWRSTLNSYFEWVKKIVVIKPADSSANVQPSIQSRRVLNDNLLIALQQMQWALLKKDNTLFHWSIEQVSQMIHKNEALIDPTAPQTIVFLQNLALLAQQNLAPKLPNIQPACQELKLCMNNLKALPEKAK